jgi:hypothetical protein
LMEDCNLTRAITSLKKASNFRVLQNMRNAIGNIIWGRCQDRSRLTSARTPRRDSLPATPRRCSIHTMRWNEIIRLVSGCL